MLKEEQLKSAIEILMPTLPNGTAMRVTSFVPQTEGMDTEAGKVFAILLSDKDEDLLRAIEVIGQGLRVVR